MKSHDLGIKGEALASSFLESKGYRILERNWRYRKAEVDIISFKENFLVAVEVKTRATDFYGEPQDFVNKNKIRLLKGAINAYVNMNDLDVEVRFDIIGIVWSEDSVQVTHLEDAYFIF